LSSLQIAKPVIRCNEEVKDVYKNMQKIKLSQDSVSHSIEKSTEVTMSLGSHEIEKSAKERQCLWVVMKIDKICKGTTLSACSHAIQKSAK
jgi:hypothetical protein